VGIRSLDVGESPDIRYGVVLFLCLHIHHFAPRLRTMPRTTRHRHLRYLAPSRLSPPSRESRSVIIAARSLSDIYLAEILKAPLLSVDAEKALARRVGTGDREARDRMTLANLRLVVRIARRYGGKGLSLEDLIAEGNIGLLRAVEEFDPEMDIRFSTYATYWVKQSIRRVMNRSGHAIQLPQYMGILLSKWQRTEDQLSDELGREASKEEVRTHLGLSVRQNRAVAKAQKVIVAGQSSRAEVYDGAQASAAFLEDIRTAAPGEHLEVADNLRVALMSLSQLESRKAAVLRQHFGRGGEEPATLSEIGKRLGLTRERVRQIEQVALAEIRTRLKDAGQRSSAVIGSI
jgi:RNA polymerase primary sigma factor